MKYPPSLSIAAVGLLAAVTLPCAHAGEATTPGEKSEFYTALSVAAPALVVSGVVGSTLLAPLTASEIVGEHRREPRAGKLPAMRVETVETLPAGARQVRLQDPQQADNTALLRWPARQDDPTAGFHVGETVSFQPSPAGAGWTVQSPQGEALAFVPTAESAAHNSSKTW
ncbi:hypothetical protein [Xanthomonas pisi]|uniref:Uncharacterized protein n=1 Tax=Xanthomonas pisi TaxID=56457 RepID=A0A2S7D3Z8_9XANT|nr:hypothetical protein [Xanthomonas pisi]KLD71422.1 hypothetical protein Y887_06360 [Xanthomonas pisi DSM 18956]PPU68563.1 hypothetical protein XpiCFBP4643_08615 [Xanthomonas pisi]